MPYSIEEGNSECESGEWAVVKDDDGSVLGCHSSKKDAESQIAALYASEDSEDSEERHVTKITFVVKK